ncbi:ATP-dependent RNA helicase DBP5 [Alternaria alternata]|nr:ATP-dependent RNA helicase DBP5 [Alternaria alternata]
MSTTEETPIKQEPVEAAPSQEPQEPQESSLEQAQADGSGPPGNGSALAEPEFKVEVKLADLQADPNNPLYSVKSFEELNL